MACEGWKMKDEKMEDERDEMRHDTRQSADDKCELLRDRVLSIYARC